jgi:DNA mismatch repair protein MutS2
MTNIVSILDTFTDKSLILVDELGSGTDPIEGAHLAISLLETFHDKGAFTLATTHYSEIKQYCLTHEGFENASCEFDIETLKPTYHLLLGIPGKSNAFAICNQLGVPKEIIDRASNLISKPDTDFETLMKQIYDNKKQVEEEKIEIEKNLNQVTLLRKSLEKDNNEKLQKEKAKIEEAKKEAQQILLDAKDDANRIINKLSKMNEAETHKANKLRDELNDKIKKNGGDGLDLSVLLKLNEKDTSSLSKSKKTSQNSKAYVRNNKAKTINTEINLLGLTVDEAVAELDLYFDQAKMAHLEKVRVVHGKGTGKLREGVHQYLKTNKNVKTFKIADYGDGDYGVTIVELK